MSSVNAQLSAPEAEDVFGGRILDVTTIPRGSSITRVFISTESANSVFYADVNSTVAANATSSGFAVMPGLDAAAGYGSNIRLLAGHENSGKVFFATQNGIRSADIIFPTIGMVENNGPVNDLVIIGDRMYFTRGNNVHFGDLSSSGAYTEDAASPITVTAAGMLSKIEIQPSTGLMYVLEPGNSPVVYKSNDAAANFVVGTSFSALGMTGFSATVDWRTIGFSSTDRLFVAGDEQNPPAKFMRYTDNELVWVDVVLPAVNPGDIGFGVSGPKIKAGLANHVYWASLYSTNNGVTWNQFGNTALETNPNDGSVWVDSNNDSIVYLTTDMGFGVSLNAGSEIFEANDGILAVQVNDIDMTTDKENAWVASKSGVRQVRNYTSSPVWSNAIYPNGDGSPYYSVAMEDDDTSQVYVGNVRIYKSGNGGSTWSQVFTPEVAPYNFPGFASGAMAIEVCDCDSAIVMVGYEVFDQDEGGVFFSHDAGTTWTQLLLEASADGFDVDVSDIAFNIEGSDTVAYITAKYDLASPQGRSIYKAVKAGASWTVSQEMNSGNTSTGALIVASLEDVHVSSTGDTIMCVGTDAGNNHPTAYYKIRSGTNVWTPYTFTGFPYAPGKIGTAITLGVDTIYCAVDHEIYYLDLGGSWQLGHSYPVGTEINFLYFDDLLAGTSYGLYEHESAGSPFSINEFDKLYISNIYPNPASDYFEVSFDGILIGNLEVQAYTIDGKRVMNKSFQEAKSFRVDISNWRPGTYVVHFIDESDASTSIKIIKQ